MSANHLLTKKYSSYSRHYVVFIEITHFRNLGYFGNVKKAIKLVHCLVFVNLFCGTIVQLLEGYTFYIDNQVCKYNHLLIEKMVEMLGSPEYKSNCLVFRVRCWGGGGGGSGMVLLNVMMIRLTNVDVTFVAGIPSVTALAAATIRSTASLICAVSTNSVTIDPVISMRTAYV